MKHIESLFIFQLTLLVLLSSNLLGQSDAETTYRSNNKYITLLKSQELSYESKIKNPKDFVISANTNTLKLSENELNLIYGQHQIFLYMMQILQFPKKLMQNFDFF